MQATFVLLICVVASASAAVHDRIIGGSEINITDAPYQVSVQYHNSHRCGGAILTEQYIVSSASCLYEVSTVSSSLTFRRIPTDAFSIRLGSTYRNENGTIYSPQKTYHHPKFDITSRTATLDYDIAIFKLSSYVTLNETAKRVSLPTSGTIWPFETVVYMTGWGYSSWTGTTFPLHLQGVTLKLSDSEDCSMNYGRNYTSRMICVGVDNAQSPWTGDFGGPLVLADGDYGTDTLIGISSFGSSKAPSVFTNVAHPEIHQFLYQIIYNSDD